MIQSNSTSSNSVTEPAVPESGPGAAPPTRRRRAKKSSTRPCRCKIEWLDAKVLPAGSPYWAVLTCGRCGQPRRWLAPPKPLVEAVEPLPEPPSWLTALAEQHQGGPAALVGTERQCRWASSIRTEMKSKHWDSPEMIRILDVVNHPGWLIRNRGTIRSWPTPAEVVAADPGPDPAAPPADGGE